MFIDIHVHTRTLPGPSRGGKQPYATPAQLIARYDAIEVERAVILPGVSPECSLQPQSNEEVLAIARENDRFIPFCNVDPRAVANSPTADLGHVLRHYREQGAKGLGEITANLPFLDPLVQNLFRHCQEVGFPVTFHIAPAVGGYYGLYDDPGLPQLELTLKRYPDLIFLGHSQPFWAEMAPLPTVGARDGYPDTPITTEGAIPRLMRCYPNLCGDLSANSGRNALARDQAYAAKFLTEFQDRLFFGTDICAPDTPTGLVDLLLELRGSGAISETVFQKVARENAIRLLNL